MLPQHVKASCGFHYWPPAERPICCRQPSQSIEAAAQITETPLQSFINADIACGHPADNALQHQRFRHAISLLCRWQRLQYSFSFQQTKSMWQASCWRGLQISRQSSASQTCLTSGCKLPSWRL